MKFKTLLLVLLYVVTAVVVMGCTAEQIAQSEHAREMVRKATTNPVAQTVQHTVPYGELAAGLVGLGLVVWGGIDQALRSNRKASAKASA